MKPIVAIGRFVLRIVKWFWRWFYYRPLLLAIAATEGFWLWCIYHAKDLVPLLLLGACLFTSGCIRTDATSTGRQVERREFQEQTTGSDGIPVTKTGSETITRESESATTTKTGLDEAAIGSLIQRGIQAAMGNYAGALHPSNGSTEALVGGGASTLLALALAYMQKKRGDEHKADADEGWERATPRQSPPNPPNITTKGPGA